MNVVLLVSASAAAAAVLVLSFPSAHLGAGALLFLCSAGGAAVSGETLNVFTELLSKTEFHPLIAHSYCFREMKAAEVLNNFEQKIPTALGLIPVVLSRNRKCCESRFSA